MEIIKDRPFLSVVIPIYNGSRFIPHLFEILKAQGAFNTDSDKSIEVVFVDDGSLDDSPSLLSELSAHYPLIRCHFQKNQGQPKARNAGLSMARGKYVYFMDQDDALVPGSLVPMCLTLDEAGGDVIRFNFQHLAESKFDDWKTYKMGEVQVTGHCNGQKFIEMTSGFSWGTMVWTSIFNREFLVRNNVFFEPNIRYLEDNMFNWKVMLKAEHVILADNLVYFWVDNNESESRVRDISHRIRRESYGEYVAMFYSELYQQIKADGRYLDNVKNLLERSIQWNVYSFWGFVLRYGALNCMEAKAKLQKHTDMGLYPYPKSYPQLHVGYPNTFKYRLMWKLMRHRRLLIALLWFRSLMK